MYCPECGHDAGDARFCPECGANLAGVKDALRGAAPAEPAVSGDAAAPRAVAAGGPRRLSPSVIWMAFGALAVIVILIVVMVSGGFGGNDSATADATTDAVQQIEADTSGSYDELVQRANELYEQGLAAFQNQSMEQGAAYFLAATKVYEAAWNKQATDPNVGTDLAVSLFYTGDIDAALEQIDAVLKESPDFQQGWLNKGIFLEHEARLAEQSDNAKEAKQADELFDEAKVAYTKAAAIDPKSDAGKQASESLKGLSK